MRRWIPLALALVFVVLFLMTLYSWARSYLPRHLTIEADAGRVFLVFWEGGNSQTPQFDPGERYGPRPGRIWQSLRGSATRVTPDWEVMGFGTVGGRRQNHTVRLVAIPCWFLALLTAGGSVACGVFAWRQRRRLRSGQCVSCGYDLRATPEAGGELVSRCPECGTDARAVTVN
jgi:hypothetical protein